MEQYNVLSTLPEAMTIIGGLVMILILLIILNSVHKQAKRIQELQAEMEFAETKEEIAVEEESNG